MLSTTSAAKDSSKRKRKSDVGSGSAGSLSSARPRVSEDSTESTKLSALEKLANTLIDGSLFESKEDNRTLQVTYTCNDDSNEKFSSLEEVAKYFLEQKVDDIDEWMNHLSEDEVFEDALISIARDGNEKAISICNEYDIDIEEEEEEDVGVPVESTKKGEDEDEDTAEEGAENAKFGLSKDDYQCSVFAKESAVDRFGAFLTSNIKTVIVEYLDKVPPMEKKLKELNAVTVQEIEDLNALEKSDSPHKEKKRIKAAKDKKKALLRGRNSFHQKKVNALVKDLKDTFIAYGFELPKHLEEEYSDELEKHSDLRKIFFPTTKKGKKSKKAKA